MPGINSLLSIGYQALSASQAGITVSSNNISNASTEGYTRQRAVIEANRPTYYPQGALGSGARLVNVEQLRDVYLDQTYRRETSTAAFADARNGILSRLETALFEPGDVGIAGRIDGFFNAWSELAANPNEATVKSQLRQTGIELANSFNNLSAQIDLARQEGESRLGEAVARVNQLTSDIRDYNRQIVGLEASGITATDLRDARNLAIDELSNLVDVQVHNRDDGSVGVTLQGYSIADRDDTTNIELRFSGGAAGIGIEGRTGFVANVGGQIGGTVKALNDDLGDTRQRLNDLAAAIVDEVNTLVNTGVSPNGATGIDFFDPAGTTASSMALSADILADLDNLPVATGDGLGAYRAGANDIALALADFRESPSATLGESYASNYRGLVSDVGVALRSSQDVGAVAQTLADGAANRREAISGVSTDEELVNLIRYQTAYQAAARIISTADELLETVLQL